MKKRKLLAMLLLIVTVGSLFVAYKKEVPPDAAPGTELSAKWKKKIAKDFLASYNVDSFYWYDEASAHDGARHYGTYNGYIVLFQRTHMSVLCKEMIGTYDFCFGSSFVLLAYKDGEFLELKEAYAQNLFTDGQIAEIHGYHKSIFPIYYDEGGSL